MVPLKEPRILRVQGLRCRRSLNPEPLSYDPLPQDNTYEEYPKPGYLGGASRNLDPLPKKTQGLCRVKVDLRSKDHEREGATCKNE